MTNEPARPASRERIAQAEQDIAAAEMRLTDQRPLAEQLAADGHAKEAEALLRTMEQALHVMREHRAIILQEIARAETRDAPS